ncbi:MAG: hypothetical protein AAGG51_25265 [Cyanobacteria bacterium P01_G01_bin.54]
MQPFLTKIPQPLWTAFKILSTILIIAALALELWHQQANLTHKVIPAFLTPLFWLERLALGGHLIEAGIALTTASGRMLNPFTYSIYTFFVGFVGLVELFTQPTTPGGVSRDR